MKRIRDYLKALWTHFKPIYLEAFGIPVPEDERDWPY